MDFYHLKKFYSIFKDKNIDFSKAKIKDVIKEGQELLVQVEKMNAVIKVLLNHLYWAGW